MRIFSIEWPSLMITARLNASRLRLVDKIGLKPGTDAAGEGSRRERSVPFLHRFRSRQPPAEFPFENFINGQFLTLLFFSSPYFNTNRRTTGRENNGTSTNVLRNFVFKHTLSPSLSLFRSLSSHSLPAAFLSMCLLKNLQTSRTLVILFYG